MLLLALIAACAGGDKDTAETGDTGPTACPQLDCRDALTLTVLDPSGAPSDWFEGRVTPAGGAEVSFVCGDASTFEGGYCAGDGVVVLWLYAETVDVWLDEGDDAPYWSGSITPAWTAPYDSEACGHYCYLAEETVTLEPCVGCG